MATTLQNLIDGVRIETRDPNGITFQDEDIIRNVDQAYKNVYQLVANTKNANYFLAEVTMDIVAGEEYFDLPDALEDREYIRVVNIFFIPNSNTKIPLYRYDRGIEPYSTGNATFGWVGSLPTFRFKGRGFVLEPTPINDIDGGICVEVLLAPETLVAPSDTVHEDFKDLWSDLVILRATKACLGQLEAVGGIVSYGPLNERLKETEDQVKESLALRALSPVKKRRRGFFQ